MNDQKFLDHCILNKEFFICISIKKISIIDDQNYLMESLALTMGSV